MSSKISAFLIFTCILWLSLNSTNADVLPELRPPFEVLGDSDEELRTTEYHHTEDDGEKSLLNCTNYVTEEDFILLENGSLYLHGQKLIFHYGSFFLNNGSAYFCGDELPEITSSPKYNFSEEFLQCGHVLIEPEEYKLLPNGTVYIQAYSKNYGPLDYFIVDNGVYICVPSYDELKLNRGIPESWHKFSRGSDYLTFIGLLISIVCLLLHLVMFGFVPSVRNLPGCCLASLSFSLLMAYLCFLTAFLLESEVLCAGLGMCVYYFFLTSFFWMNTIAFDVWRSFRVVMRELRISSQSIPWRRFSLYSLYSWVIPAVLTILVKVFDSTDVLPEEYRPSFGDPYCWFGQRKALLLFFAVPLIVVMLLNIAYFADVIYVINRATMKNATAHDANLKKRFVMFTRLALIMGLTWIFGIAAGFADKPFLWYIFIILNTLQGLFIFGVFMGSSKVRSLCFQQYKNRGKRTSMSVRTISAAL